MIFFHVSNLLGLAYLISDECTLPENMIRDQSMISEGITILELILPPEKENDMSRDPQVMSRVTLLPSKSPSNVGPYAKQSLSRRERRWKWPRHRLQLRLKRRVQISLELFEL
ncbi:hypothetical protein VNO78_18334 [Psophocarpus tetragonolobus]|uniref:Uncharacterized protein n=1 Tax=Psophocarpus tetragonolobus TaxID=3891 RepID=A0AAN9XLE5_PSOTE